jgi:hypothetical protein
MSRVDSPNGVAGSFTNFASSGNVITGNNSAHRIFRVDVAGNVYASGSFNPTGADYAESVDVRGKREEYGPGDVLVIDPESDRTFMRSNEPYSRAVAGVYSTKPGILGSMHDSSTAGTADNEVPLAMVGIVPCHVTAENGPIRRGDLLVTSASRRGYAMRATNRDKMQGAIIGKALQNLDSGEGTIEILVSLQ